MMVKKIIKTEKLKGQHALGFYWKETYIEYMLRPTKGFLKIGKKKHRIAVRWFLNDKTRLYLDPLEARLKYGV